MTKRSLALALCPLLFTALLSFASGGAEKKSSDKAVQHVLLISVDGLHALDVSRYVTLHPTSALAELSSHGTTYTDANTPQNSDSFPGLLALITGGSPVTSGLFYDVSYDRTIFAPTNTTCTGGAGNMMVFDESIDK
jgi:predicted AlkP superfamily pyrophosphatase or phosphodiesterase